MIYSLTEYKKKLYLVYHLLLINDFVNKTRQNCANIMMICFIKHISKQSMM